MEAKEKRKKPKYNMWQNVVYMVKNAWKVRKSVLFIATAMGTVTAALTVTRLLVTPIVLKYVEKSASLSSLILVILVFSFLLVGLSGLLAYLKDNKLFGRIDVRSSIIFDVATKFCETSYSNLMDTDFIEANDSATRATSANSRSTEHIWETLQGILANILGFVAFLFVVTGLDMRLMAVVIVTSGLSYLVSKKIDENAENPELAEKIEINFIYIINNATNRTLAKDIRIFGLKNWIDELKEKSYKAYREYRVGSEKKKFFANICDVILTFLRNGIAYLILIKMTLDNGMAASEFLLYFGAIGGFSEWVKGILEGFLQLHKESLEISRMREFLDWEEPFRFEGGETLDISADMRYEICLDNVSYLYPHAKDYTIRNLSLTVRGGEKLAIVGLNGAGKTTLVKLICGLLDPTEGSILLNGTDIRKYNRRDYYKLFSSVFQDFSVIAGSVAENVAQSVTDVNVDKVMKCIENAGLKSMIEELKDGIETKVGREVFLDGHDFSGGQMQRLMLARALYKDAPILTLDEPTAALDPIAENDIYLKYNSMTKGRTSLFISHRLASTRFCDRIILLSGGNIIEEGTHEELMSQQGEYANLFEVQSKYYREEESGYERNEAC